MFSWFQLIAHLIMKQISMKENFSKLNTALKKSYKQNQKSSNGIIGRCNDKVLHSLIAEINADPAKENFISFVQTLNFFYSTRLQTAKGKRNQIVIDTAEIIHR